MRRQGFSKSDFKGLLVFGLLFMFLFVALANVTPTLHDELNQTNDNDNSDNSTLFEDVPGGELVKDNITLFILLVVLIATVIVGVNRVL